MIALLLKVLAGLVVVGVFALIVLGMTVGAMVHRRQLKLHVYEGRLCVSEREGAHRE